MRHAAVTVTTCLAIAFTAGCKKTADNTVNYSNAIDAYYASRPACLWSEEIKFPVQANTSDSSKTQPYDALVDQGLLVRTTGEKKEFIIASKQVNNYDLSSNGRNAWKADPNQPGYGNFCYGVRKVTHIDSAAPTGSDPGATAVVYYHYNYPDAPSWAKSPEIQTAFPQVQSDFSAEKQDSATLTDTANGWAVTNVPSGSSGAPTHGAASPADGSIVH